MSKKGILINHKNMLHIAKKVQNDASSVYSVLKLQMFNLKLNFVS